MTFGRLRFMQVLRDLSAVFNIINYSILLGQLRELGVGGMVQQRFSFLQGQFQWILLRGWGEIKPEVSALWDAIWITVV